MTRSPGRRGLWGAAIAVLAVLLVVRNLIGLDSAPVGAYVDETSIGYNAWAISTHGVDEHGAHLPLYFTAFGEYKNPLYIYTLSLLLKVLPLSVATERLPAALFGMLTCLFIALIAWRRSRSLPITAFALGLAALTPWLTVESRVGFEVISIVAMVAAALWCLAHAQDGGQVAWYAAAGGLLGVAVFAYSTGRVAVVLFSVALVVAECWRRRSRVHAWLATMAPIVAAYVALGVWNLAHPGALTARFSLISIGADGAPPLTVLGRFVANYLTYFGPDFLFVTGDRNPRHNTQFGGMLLWLTLPLLLAGLAAAWRRRTEPFMRFLVLGALLAPVSAALTEESVPHAVRASVTLPFLLVLAVEGIVLLRDSGRARRGLTVAVAVTALVVQGALFTVDLYATWPARSAVAFDSGEIDAITRAAALTRGGPLLLSQSLDQPYIQAAFALRPVPPATFVPDSATPLLSAMNMVLIDGANPPTRPGAIAVLSAVDPAPAGAQVLFSEVTPAASLALGAAPQQYVSVVVYRLG